MEYDETARLKKRYKNEGLLGDAEFSGLKSLLQTKIAPESAGARSLLDVLQSASNMSAENISAPVEGIAWLLEKAGMPIKDPVLGQKWMADRGLTRHVKEGAQKVIGDAAGMLLPFAGTKAGAQAIAKGLLDIGENGLPVGLSIKDVSKAYPQEEALKLAQQRAALPVEKGGLGLPANNTAAQRAEAMGFDTPAYHGSNKKFTQFKNSGDGIFFSDSKPLAKEYGKKVYEVLLNTGNEKVFDAAGKGFNDAEAYRALTDGVRRMRGDSSMVMKNFMDAPNPGLEAPLSTVTAINNPNQARLMSAAFDPFRKTAATAALMGVAAPDLLAQEAPQMSKEEIEYLYGLLGQ